MTDSAANMGGGSNLGTFTNSNSQSTSTPVAIQTPQSQYSLALAQQAAAAGNNQYNWAQNQYGYLRGIANEAIPEYLKGAATSEDLANKQLAQYEGMYLPAQQQFDELANTYSSPARQNYAMGQAEADSTQASNAAWQNTRKQLQSAGVDPSSGEYAGLQAAANTAAGASAAGAANQARSNVENTGIGLQEQNINFGQTEPASALNAINANYAGQAGAVNTGQSTVNTAANAYNSADQFYNTATQAASNNGVSGQNSQSTSTSSGVPKTGYGLPSGNVSYEEGGLVDDGYRRGGRVRRGGGGRRGKGGGGGGGVGDPSGAGKLYQNPGGDWSPQPSTPMAPPAPGTTYDTSSSVPNPGSPGSGGAPNRGSPLPEVASAPPVNVGASMDPSVPGGGADLGAAQGGGIPEPHGHQGRPHPPHPYAVNGLPDASTGGHVPYELSPSHGHTTDDVVANLNAGEFVIPRRTVHHLGHKFLYDLIGKSDKEMGMHPQPVGPQSLKKGSGADKARGAAESQNFLNGGGI